MLNVIQLLREDAHSVTYLFFYHEIIYINPITIQVFILAALV